MPARSQPSKRGSSPAIFEMSMPAKSITPRRSSRSIVLSSMPIWSSGVTSAVIAPLEAFGSVSRQNGASSTMWATVGLLSPITLNCVFGRSCARTGKETATSAAPSVRFSMGCPPLDYILQQALLLDEPDDVIQALTGLEIGENERALAAHPLRIALHDFERRADHRREVDLVDHQQVGLGDARPALARDLVARGDVDHVKGEVGELRAEGRGEVVAAGFDEHHIELGEAARQAVDRLEVDRRVLADRGVRAAAGLDADDALGRERLVAHQELRVLLGIDVVGHHRDVVLV